MNGRSTVFGVVLLLLPSCGDTTGGSGGTSASGSGGASTTEGSGGTSTTAGSGGTSATSASTSSGGAGECADGEVWCPGCNIGEGDCYQGGCPAAACAECSSIDNEADCAAR